VSFSTAKRELRLVPAGVLEVAASLPAVRIHQAVFEATEEQALPPLVTTAFRGALLRSLKDLACVLPSRETCTGCPHTARCAYPPLVEPRDDAAHEVPSPLVLRPSASTGSARAGRLTRGQPLAVQVAFVGDAGHEHVSLVRAALAGVARRGLGHKPRPRARRPGLELVSFSPAAPSVPAAGPTWNLHFDTPCRLTVAGRPASAPTAKILWDAVVRRVRLLSGLYGGGAPALPIEPPWTLDQVDVRTVAIGRFSERQKRRMTWEGFVGRARLRARGDVELADRLLGFVEQVQLGKGTQFGFGVVRRTGAES